MVYGMDTGQLESPADRYGQGSKFYKNTKRVLKILAYFFYFLLVLSSAVASKGSFLLMTQSLGNAKQERQYASRWSILIVAAMCIPYIFIFMESIAHSLFRNRKGPSIFDIMIVFLLEGIHSFGLCLLVFRVLPSCDVIRAVLLMNCLCIVPGFCKMVFSKNSAGPVGKALIVMIDFIALIAQITVFFVIMGTEYTAFIEKAMYESTPSPMNEPKPVDIAIDPFAENSRQVGNDPNDMSGMGGSTEKPKWKGSWEAPFALLFTSVSWWENYIDRDIKLFCINMPLATYKRHLQSVRSKANIGASLWKIALTITFSVIMLPSKKFENAFVKMPSMPDPIMTTLSPGGGGGGGYMGGANGPMGGGDSMIDFGGFDNNMDNTARKIKRDIQATTMTMISSAMNLESVLTVPNNAWNSPTTPNLFDFIAIKEKTADDYWKTIHPFIPFIVHFFATGLCYYFAKSSCKMCMQRVAFALPLTLATPVTIGIYIAICHGGLDRIDFIKDMMYWECSETFSKGNLKWQLIFGLGLWWLSEIWIAIHSWFPENKRLASTEVLFVLPQYDSALIEQSLLLNRRRNEKEHLKRKLEEHFEELDIVDGMASIDNDKQFDIIPKIYLCGTLWHETKSEMIQILKSIMRMDIDQSARKKAKDYFNVQDPDIYEIESHIFFDDAFEKTDRGDKTINMFVKDLIGAIDKAASIVHDIDGMKMTPPVKTPTPYGGRLTWKLPGGNLLVVHLKDKKRVLKRKRWSMVMYMYYLLGYRLLGQCEDRLQALYKMVEEDPRRRKHKRHVAQGEEVHIYYKDVLGPKLLLEAENTYILSMDGDVDFGPDSVRMLVDRMKKNKRVGAACGRIHPIGSGPMIWFQKMEYALSYWLQKTTEHSLGCVLCAPGCFSMYRASALMDDNVMRMFAQKPEDPDDHILHDLGEDRWLSRLLIEQGYKIEYSAASDAYTHAPETITEFFNQRRRWIPSTLGNTVSFLKNYRRTIRLNENVSFLCILYHICFLASYILSPATITIAIADAFNATTDIDMWGSFILACLPAIVFLIVCYQNWKEEVKIGFAAMLGTYYSILMMIVVVGTIVRVVDGSWKTTAVLFLIIMAIIFFLTAICHPFELNCVKPCFLFFLCIPSSYILVIIYSLTNMNQCTWGTRDNVYVPQKRRKVNLDENDIKELEKQLTDAKANNELINKIEELLENGPSNSNDELLLQILAALERIEMKETIDKQLEKGVDVEKLIEHQYANNELLSGAVGKHFKMNGDNNAEETAAQLFWLTQEDALKFSDIRYLDDAEVVFWKKLIKKYLSVDKIEPAQKHKLQVGLDDMRDRGVFAFFMLNALWIAFVFPVLLAQDRLKDMLYIPIPIPSLYYQPVLIEPLGVLHLGFFVFISLTQFIAMLCHRYNTFQHILASTKLRSNIHEGMRIEDIIDTVKMLQQIKPIDEEAEPMPDYSDDEIDKVSDDISESDEVMIDGKPVKHKLKGESDNENKNTNYDSNDAYLRHRLGKQGHDNPAFIDDTNINSKGKNVEVGRSRSEDPLRDNNIDAIVSVDNNEGRMQIAKRNRRSRRLQKKNSLDVQFRRRFSMLRDGNAAANNIYNESESAFNVGDMDANNGAGGRESRASSMMPNLGPRASSGNLSTKILDKRFNKMLFNMHGIPVKPNVTNQHVRKHTNSSSEQHQVQAEYANELGGGPSNHKGGKGNRKRKNQNIVEQNV